jgi:hypothetical protein
MAKMIREPELLSRNSVTDNHFHWLLKIEEIPNER